MFCTGNSILLSIFDFANEMLHCFAMPLNSFYKMFDIIVVFPVTLQVVRTSLMSCLLKTLKHNIDHPRPIKVLLKRKQHLYVFSVRSIVLLWWFHVIYCYSVYSAINLLSIQFIVCLDSIKEIQRELIRTSIMECHTSKFI
jgi:hypothetical protein